jgi:hypothetical protein
MKTINIGLYQFCELTEAAQAKALELERYTNVEFEDWYEYTLNDFCTICETIGIEIEEKNISFQGFYSQGDGSSFDATVNITALINGIQNKTWKDYAPLLELPLSAPRVNRRILKLIANGSIDFVTTTERRGSSNLKIDTEYNYTPHRSRGHNRIDAQLDKLESWVEKSLAMLNLYLYKSLQESYEIEISDEAVKEAIEGSQYLFTADGNYAQSLLKLAI